LHQVTTGMSVEEISWFLDFSPVLANGNALE
jgi:hypothetical protein